MTAQFLEELAGAMRTAAYRLEQGRPFEQAWAQHLLEDGKAVLALSQTWREPEAADVEGAGRWPTRPLKRW